MRIRNEVKRMRQILGSTKGSETTVIFAVVSLVLSKCNKNSLGGLSVPLKALVKAVQTTQV